MYVQQREYISGLLSAFPRDTCIVLSFVSSDFQTQQIHINIGLLFITFTAISKMKASSILLAPITKRLEGKVALITGAATGIGESSARLFARHGAKVVIANVQDSLSQSVCEGIGSKEAVSYVNCDVTNEAHVQKAVDDTVTKYGRLDIMFSNAGIIGKRDPRISALDYEELKSVFSVNVYGAFLAGKHASRVMIPEKRGSIIYTASVSSVIAGDVPRAYTASKHAIVGLTKDLCAELGKYGIRVNCVSPSGVPTTTLRSSMSGIDKRTAQELIATTANLKQVLLDEEDVAQAAVFLASDESKYVSGLNLLVDGGFSTTNRTFGKSLK